MQLTLSKKPKNPTIILGFPGFGLVGSIATEFLISHLKTQKIGKILLTAMAAIHQQKVVDTLSIYHDAQYNLLIMHGIASPKGLEWELASTIEKIAKSVGAKEFICLEGVGASKEKPSVLYHASLEKSRLKLNGI